MGCKTNGNTNAVSAIATPTRINMKKTELQNRRLLHEHPAPASIFPDKPIQTWGIFSHRAIGKVKVVVLLALGRKIGRKHLCQQRIGYLFSRTPFGFIDRNEKEGIFNRR